MGLPLFSNTDRAVMVELVESIWDASRWQSGDLIVHVSMYRLTSRCLIDDRQLRRVLKKLEAYGWLLRRYDARNRRQFSGGIDLRPLAARLDELVDADLAIERKIEMLKLQAKAEMDDRLEVEEAIAALAESNEEGESSMADMNVRISSLQSHSHPLRDVSKEARQGSVAEPTAPRKRTFDPADEREMMDLMLANSVLLAKAMNPADLADPTPLAVTRAIAFLLREHGVFREIRPALFVAACDRHGLAAGAAALIAFERPGIRNPVKYLAGMLHKPSLRMTIKESLRRMAYEPQPRKDN
ncbi:hypothetical protein KL86APRO_11329 [uncultured Alphaproteobacteria bacterium]|uniref:Replication protein C n=1 Tax=uncultured Alphaproteobacteria bacterium TaxID=91750 RepID=A0A212JN10_9PROT|nr:hypothetical protein KL86APRO_11329 [uncultured Alphaproteobacteria bacterium]